MKMHTKSSSYSLVYLMLLHPSHCSVMKCASAILVATATFTRLNSSSSKTFDKRSLDGSFNVGRRCVKTACQCGDSNIISGDPLA